MFLQTFIMKKILFICSLISLIFLNACKKEDNLGNEITELQNEVAPSERRSCGMQEHHSRLLQDPTYLRSFEKKMEKMEQAPQNRSALCAAPTLLPIAIHYQGISNPDVDCLIELAKDQVDLLNKDYQGTNNDIDDWTNNASGSFPGVNFGETCVKFCIASKNHPNGYNLSNGDLAVTVNQTSGDQVNAWAGYINLFVRPNLGYLGYSPLGGSGNGDGVVVDATAFGAGSGCGPVSPQSPYNLGRTLTHELGHYLFLDHIWGNGGCNSDDGVNDTPVSTEEYYGCPNIGESSCSSTDLHMNYMDYTNDACMYMFTNGQSTRMENYFEGNLQNVINNASNVCDEGNNPKPTCNDGIQNGQETGVDCGGPDCEPCNTDPDPTCNDGIQNGQETGVDCGGPDCEPCNTNPIPSCDDGIQNGQETGVDCGGPDCEPCYSNPAPSCDDGIQNGQETGVDCGGPKCEPCNTDPSECEGTEISFELILDDYGSETSWYLVSEYGEELAEGGPYQDGTSGELIAEDFCLEDGCYYFEVADDYGDGICCYYGEGSFSILDSDGNTVAASSGEFGYWDYLDFCVEDGEVYSWSFRTDPRSAARSNANKRQ